MSTLKERIRAITDALPEGQWLRMRDIAAKLDPKPSQSGLSVSLVEMWRRGFLERREGGVYLEFRSSAAPMVDGRTAWGERRRGKKRDLRSLGNVALARLQRENPAEFARLTRDDGPEWRRGA